MVEESVMRQVYFAHTLKLLISEDRQSITEAELVIFLIATS